MRQQMRICSCSSDEVQKDIFEKKKYFVLSCMISVTVEDGIVD